MIPRPERRDANEPAIVKALRTCGATVVYQSANLAPGIPDLLVGFRGETFLLEVKMPKGALTDAQVKFHANWTGSPIHIVHDETEAERAIGAID